MSIPLRQTYLGFIAAAFFVFITPKAAQASSVCTAAMGSTVEAEANLKGWLIKRADYEKLPLPRTPRANKQAMDLMKPLFEEKTAAQRALILIRSLESGEETAMNLYLASGFGTFITKLMDRFEMRFGLSSPNGVAEIKQLLDATEAHLRAQAQGQEPLLEPTPEERVQRANAWLKSYETRRKTLLAENAKDSDFLRATPLIAPYIGTNETAQRAFVNATTGARDLGNLKIQKSTGETVSHLLDVIYMETGGKGIIVMLDFIAAKQRDVIASAGAIDLPIYTSIAKEN
jgi:hypothetical protein